MQRLEKDGIKPKNLARAARERQKCESVLNPEKLSLTLLYASRAWLLL